MDAWAWGDHLAPWLGVRVELPVGALFCVIDGPTRGRPWSATAARGELRRHATAAGVRRRFAPHQLRHAHAVELAREGVPLPVIQRQLGHSHVSTTSVYLQGSTSRRRGDHRHDPRAASADDARQRRPRTLRLGPSDDRVGRGPRGS
jgi:integrase